MRLLTSLPAPPGSAPHWDQAEAAVGVRMGTELGACSLTHLEACTSPRRAEVCAAQVNANLLTANKHIKWKLLKKSILKKLLEMSFLS